MENRLRESSRMLDLSYRLISHYDSKTNQLLTMISINFAVVGFILSSFFANIEKFDYFSRTATMLFCFLNFCFVFRSIHLISQALRPHTSKIVKGQLKPKLGLTYFKDVIVKRNEEDYVKIWLNKSNPPESPYYSANDSDALTKCLIEDNCRDFYAHAEILSVKTEHVKDAFRWVTWNMCVLFLSIIVLGIIFMFRVPLREIP